MEADKQMAINLRGSTVFYLPCPLCGYWLSTPMEHGSLTKQQRSNKYDKRSHSYPGCCLTNILRSTGCWGPGWCKLGVKVSVKRGSRVSDIFRIRSILRVLFTEVVAIVLWWIQIETQCCEVASKCQMDHPRIRFGCPDERQKANHTKLVRHHAWGNVRHPACRHKTGQGFRANCYWQCLFY